MYGSFYKTLELRKRHGSDPEMSFLVSKPERGILPGRFEMGSVV